MTDKQQRILACGLALFASRGYSATSTNEVAKQAGVSEGLIFRHFKNKEGLLAAILDEGDQKVKQLYRQIIQQPEPLKVIQAFLELPFTVPEPEYSFWKLLFTLKWELNVDSSEKIKPLKTALIQAFTDLSRPYPEMEAEFLIHYMDGLISAIVKGEVKATAALKKYLRQKYNV